MKILFWLKDAPPAQVKPEPRKVYIPDGKKRQMLKAFDDMKNGGKDRSNCLGRFDFWAMAEGICPETVEGVWTARMENGTKPFFLEVLD